MKLLTTALATAAVSLGSVLAVTQPVQASPSEEEMMMGGAIATCLYLENDMFKSDEFGRYMVKDMYNDLSSGNRSALRQIWSDGGYTRCVSALR